MTYRFISDHHFASYKATHSRQIGKSYGFDAFGRLVRIDPMREKKLKAKFARRYFSISHSDWEALASELQDAILRNIHLNDAGTKKKKKQMTLDAGIVTIQLSAYEASRLEEEAPNVYTTLVAAILFNE